MDRQLLAKTASDLVAPKKGILAADESSGSIQKRFDAVGVASTPENHRIYRQLLFTTPQVEKFISGVIMFDETVRQATDDGLSFPKYLQKKGIVPGIKVDKGLKDMANFPGEKIAEGVEGLRERLAEYWEMGLRFAKFRTLTMIGDDLPTNACITSNSEIQARYAALCQEANIVPIVEPEIFMEGKHTMDRSKHVLQKVLKETFIALDRHNIFLEGMILKSSWVHPGLDEDNKPDSKAVAKETLSVFKEILPDELPGVVFLSGGDSPENSTDHLNAMNQIGGVDWQLSFSFGRALQEPVLKAWSGKAENLKNAQNIFYKRAKLNSLASLGEYKKGMEDNI